MFLHCKEDSKSTFLGVFERPQRITLEFVYVYIHLSEAIIFRNLLTARKSQREISTVKLSSKISHAYPAVLQRIQYSGVTYMTRWNLERKIAFSLSSCQEKILFRETNKKRNRGNKPYVLVNRELATLG